MKNTIIQTNLSLNEIELGLLDLLQNGLELIERPYQPLAHTLSLTEDELFVHMYNLMHKGVLRRVAGSFDPGKLGLTSTLCGAVVEPQFLEGAAALVSSYPEVTHNYSRKDTCNLWFTVITPYAKRIDYIISALQLLEGVKEVFNLPMSKRYKLSVHFSMNSTVEKKSIVKSEDDDSVRLDDIQRRIVSDLQRGFSLEKEPFQPLANRYDLSIERLLTFLSDLKYKGVLRKIGGFLNHTKTAYLANAMLIFRVDENYIEIAGRKLSQKKYISHCYGRKKVEQWPYNLYAMLHDTSETLLKEKIAALKTEIPFEECRVLYTDKEFKKSSWILDTLYDYK